MKVTDYIKKYKDEICYIQCFVNRLGIYDIADKTTQSLLTAQDGPISTFMENFNLSPFLLNSTPKKVYLFSKEEYELVILDLNRETSFPKDKKTLLFLFGPEILEDDACTAYPLNTD